MLLFEKNVDSNLMFLEVFISNDMFKFYIAQIILHAYISKMLKLSLYALSTLGGLLVSPFLGSCSNITSDICNNP